MLKFVCNFAGILLLGVGILGFVTPGMPGTIFLILALACFAHAGNGKLRNWMLNNKGFGPILRDWEATQSIPLWVKWISIACIAGFSAFSIMTVQILWVQIVIGLAAAYGIYYIATRPTKHKVIGEAKLPSANQAALHQDIAKG